MSASDVINKIFGRTIQKKEMYQHARDEDEIRRKLDYKRMSSAEVELSEYKEKERQERIKIALKKYQKKQQNEFLHGHNLRKTRQIFHQPIMFKDGNVLKQRSLIK